MDADPKGGANGGHWRQCNFCAEDSALKGILPQNNAEIAGVWADSVMSRGPFGWHYFRALAGRAGQSASPLIRIHWKEYEKGGRNSAKLPRPSMQDGKQHSVSGDRSSPRDARDVACTAILCTAPH